MNDRKQTGAPPIVADLDVECAVVAEYGAALAAAAERCLRYPDVMRMARSEVERDLIRAEWLGFVRRVIGANTIAIAALGQVPGRPLTESGGG